MQVSKLPASRNINGIPTEYLFRNWDLVLGLTPQNQMDKEFLERNRRKRAEKTMPERCETCYSDRGYYEEYQIIDHEWAMFVYTCYVCDNMFKQPKKIRRKPRDESRKV